MHLWDVRNLNAPVVTYEGHSGTVFAVAPDVQKGILYSGAEDKNINRYDLLTGSDSSIILPPSPIFFHCF